MKKNLNCTHSGTISLLDVDLKCYVLKDNTRVLSGRGMQDVLYLVSDEEDKKSGARLSRFLSSKAINPFITNEMSGGHLNAISFKYEHKNYKGYNVEYGTYKSKNGKFIG